MTREYDFITRDWYELKITFLRDLLRRARDHIGHHENEGLPTEWFQKIRDEEDELRKAIDAELAE